MRIRKFFMLPDDGGAGGGFTGGSQGNATPPASTGAEGGTAGVGANGGAGAVGAGANPAGAGVGGAAQTGANIEYQPFTVPADFGAIPEATNAQITALARETGMTQAQAQKWVDASTKVLSDGMEAVRLQIAQKYSDWMETSKNDPEIKPHLDDKGQLPKVGEMINRAMGDDTKEFHKMAEETGIATNPLFIKFCLRMSKLMGEASFVGGSIGGEQKLSMLEQAKTMFPNM